MTKITTVTNRKGGAGKTTTSRNIATGLAMRGRRVLFIDFDEQASGTESFGVMPDKHAYNALTGERFEPVVTDVANLDLLPSNARLGTVQELHRIDGIDLPAAATMVRDLGSKYDHVVIDTPSKGYMQSLAIFCADHVVITTQVNMFSMLGISGVVALIEEGVERYGLTRPQITVLPVMVPRTREAFENYVELNTAFTGLMADSPIPSRTEVVEAESRMVSVFEHKRNGMVAMAYTALVDTHIDNDRPFLSDVLDYSDNQWLDFDKTSITVAVKKFHLNNEDNNNG